MPDDGALVELVDGRAPAYVHALRTPATIWSMMSSTPGRSGSMYMRDELMPSSNSSLRARSKLGSSAGAVLHRAVRGHAEALLVEPAVGVALGSAALSYVPANHVPNITLAAPAASASATSRG